MRQKQVKYLTVLKGQEYEDACQELAKTLPLKRLDEVEVNGVRYQLSKRNIKDIENCQSGQGKPAKPGLSCCLPLSMGVVVLVAFMAVAVWLALGTNTKAWAPFATIFGGSLLSTAAARELYVAVLNRNKSEILWKMLVTVGALSAFMGIWAPDFAESWNEFSKQFHEWFPG